MFYIWHEIYDPKYPKFYVLRYQKELGLQHFTSYNDLDSIIAESRKYPNYQHYFLLDDTRFHFFRFDIFKEQEQALTIDDLNAIIDERLSYLKSQTKEELLFTHIDDIYVDEKPKKHLLGESGLLFFKLNFVYLNRNSYLSFNKSYGNIENQKNIHIWPESFKTISFLKRRLERESFLLLYIKDTYCKVIEVEQGFYKKIENINFGISVLMQMYKDSDIVKYRYTPEEQIEDNPFAKNLVLQNINFYVSYLCKRLADLQMTNKDVFIVSSIIKNSYFMEVFNKEYSKYHNKYIVPFHHSQYLEKFAREWDPENIDVLVFLNHGGLKKNIEIKSSLE